MNYIQFKRVFANNTVLSLQDIFNVFPDFDQRRLVEWQKKKYLKKIINRYYIFGDLEVDEHILMRIANSIYKHSYVSLETSLSYYSLIPEAVYQITSCSTRKTKLLNTDIASFRYQSINQKLFFGYTHKKVKDINVLIASPEKAILDYLYLNKYLNTEEAIAALRINIDTFAEIINEEKLNEYLEIFGNKKLTKRYNLLRKSIYA